MKSLDQIFEEHIASLSEKERKEEYITLLKQQVLLTLYQRRNAVLSERFRYLTEQFKLNHD